MKKYIFFYRKPISSDIFLGAGPPDKPREPKVVVKSATALKVSWDQPINNGALISSYRYHTANTHRTRIFWRPYQLLEDYRKE